MGTAETDGHSTGADGRVEPGRVALVTGAGRGIGRAIAQRLAGDGMFVVATDIDDIAVRETAQLIHDASARASFRVVDLSERSKRDDLVASVLREAGRLDVLVNNAAYTGRRMSFVDLDYEEWDRVLETNLAATAFLCRAAADHMVTRGDGCIINILSIQRRLPVATYAAYVASKGAVAALTKALAVELSPSGIRVNAVEPGVIATNAFQGALQSVGQLAPGDTPATATLLGRNGTPDDIAHVVAFLASTGASFLTGAIVTADGGRTLSRRPDPFEAAFGVTSRHGRV